MAPAIFYLRAVAPAEITIRHMYRGVVPFIVLQLFTLVLTMAFPELVTWLPSRMLGIK
jgi:TRAP-type mannitol/chloroaromatic compound transport system permease large subunit